MAIVQVQVIRRNLWRISREIYFKMNAWLPVQVWMYMSGAHNKMAANPGLYRRLLEQEPEPLLVEVIEKGKSWTFFFL